MDRKWMSSNRLTKEYEEGVKEFVTFATEHAENPSRIICPCLNCCYTRRISATELKVHLVCHGIDQSYTCWTRHGETRDKSSDNDVRYELNDIDTNVYEGDRFEEMADVVEEDLRDCPGMFERLISDAEKPLYDGCSKFTRLAAVSKLYKLKSVNGWTDKSFTDLLTLLKDMLPKDNVLPTRTYDAKQMLSSVGMDYKRIHACENDCILYWNEYAALKVCPKCNASRYKKVDSTPTKVLWYFPIKSRFKRMYSSAKDAKHLTWHADERIKDGKLRHPADSPQWRKIDHDYATFAQESRNLCLALSTDGFNPHSIQSSSHSTWPVMLVIYNLPPWLCMKHKFMMLSMLISGPKQPGNDIDIYLAPLIEDLKQMWDTGIEVYDGYREESFNLRALLFGTISDFSAYANLPGYSTKGTLACPICEDSTHSMRLENYKKNVFLGHRRFLHPDHHYRWWRKAFNGNHEEGKPPLPIRNKERSVIQVPEKSKKSKFCNLLKMHVEAMGDKVQINIPMPNNIFGYDTEEFLSLNEVNEIVNHEWLSSSVICLYIRYLYQNFVQDKKPVMFLSPQKTSFLMKEGTLAEKKKKEGRPQYIADVLEKNKDKEFFLAPYNVGHHWVLIVINRIEEQIYYLDSLVNGNPNNYPDMKEIFTSGLQIYRTQNESKATSNNIKWIHLKCPYQDNTNDCGYYVMLFMREIIQQCQNKRRLPATLCHFKCIKYSVDMLTKLREDWASYVLYII